MKQGNTMCVKCEREISESLTWCPYCGEEQNGAADKPLPSEEISAEFDQAPAEPQSTGDAGPFAPARPAPRPADAIGAGPAPSWEPSGGNKVKVIGLAVLVLIGAIAAWFFLMRDDNRGDISLLSIGPGDCWNDIAGLDEDSEIADVPEVPCEEEHANEVFAVIELDDGGSSLYPGQVEVGDMAWEGCLQQFEAYVGVPYDSSPFEIYTLFPTSGSWLLEDDRGVICSAYLLDGTITAGSLRDNPQLTITPALDVSGVGDCAGLADGAMVIAQGYVDFYDGLTEAELEASFNTFPPEFLPLYKGETLIATRATALGCSFEDLNTLVRNRAGTLTYTTDVGASFAEQISIYGFFATE